MKTMLSFVTVILTLCLCAKPALAQDAPDPEDAKTPASIAQLLPEAGLGEGLDYYMVMNDSFEDEQMYLRWSIKAEGDTVVCAVQNGSPGGEFNGTEQFVYSMDGKLQSYASVNQFGDSVSTTTGKVADGKIVLTSTHAFNDPDLGDDFEQEPEVQAVDLKAIEGKYPMQCLPLVIAYHIRAGNLGYSVEVIEGLEYFGFGTMKIEDNGVEMVKHEGKQHEAHVPSVSMSFEPDPDFPGEEREQQMSMRVLNDGSIFSLSVTEGDFEVKAKRATAEEVAELVKQQPAGDGADD